MGRGGDGKEGEREVLAGGWKQESGTIGSQGRGRKGMERGGQLREGVTADTA